MDEKYRKLLAEIYENAHPSVILVDLAIMARRTALTCNDNADTVAAEMLELTAYRLESIER